MCMGKHRQVDSVRSSEELFKLRGFKHGCLWQEGKDSSTIVIDHDDAEIDTASIEPEQTIRVVQERNIPYEQCGRNP